MAKGSKKKEAKKESKKENKVKGEESQGRPEEEPGEIAVKDVITQMMITLTSLGYQKLGLPEEANKKYKDLGQARFAIDSLSALIKVAESKTNDEELQAFRNALASLQLKFVSESKTKGQMESPNTA